MRRAGFVLAVLVAAGLAASCDSSQPKEGGTTNIGVEFSAQAIVVPNDCYDRWIDTDADNTPDVFDRVICFEVVVQSLPKADVPWPYSFRVIILRNGATFPEVLVGSVNTGGAFPVFGNSTSFDTQVTSAPIKLPEPPYYYLNPRRVNSGHPDFFLGRGLPLPTPNILGVTATTPGGRPRYEFEIQSGDSVIIEAAKQKMQSGPSAMFPGPPNYPAIDPDLRLSARLFVGGAEVTPHAGTVQSDKTDGAGISFNYISD